jgi:hypothetical protein
MAEHSARQPTRHGGQTGGISKRGSSGEQPRKEGAPTDVAHAGLMMRRVGRMPVVLNNGEDESKGDQSANRGQSKPLRFFMHG